MEIIFIKCIVTDHVSTNIKYSTWDLVAITLNEFHLIQDIGISLKHFNVSSLKVESERLMDIVGVFNI